MTASTAAISACGFYRTELTRVWNEALLLLVVVMVNPSTADARKNDPTILTLIHFAKLWGYGGIFVVNPFTYRSSTQAALIHARDPYGPECLTAWQRAREIATTQNTPMLCAWGNGGALLDADKRFLARVGAIPLIVLGLTKDGHPKHPLARGAHRIPRDQMPIPWVPHG